MGPKTPVVDCATVTAVVFLLTEATGRELGDTRHVGAVRSQLAVSGVFGDVRDTSPADGGPSDFIILDGNFRLGR